MSLNIRALALTGGVAWGALCMLVALVNLAFPSYGGALLEMAESFYPGYHGPAGLGSVIVVTLYAALDGVVCGAVLGWLYNAFARRLGGAAAQP